MNPAGSPGDGSTVRTLRLLWIGFFFALVAYLVVAVLITRGRVVEPGSDDLVRTLRWLFLALGTICFICSFRVRERMLGRLRGAGEEKAKATQTAFLVGWAFLDAIALFGLVLAFLGGSLMSSLPWIVAAIFGLIFQRPDRTELERWLGSGPDY